VIAGILNIAVCISVILVPSVRHIGMNAAVAVAVPNRHGESQAPVP
jgi:hypothetical protein